MANKSGFYQVPKSAEELIARYNNGERTFHKTILHDEVIEISLPGIDLSESILNIVFSDVDLTGACFRGADLAFTHFDATLEDADLEGADLTWTTFGWSNLKNANLKNTDLRHTSFTSGDLTNCDFSNAKIDQTCFLDVSLSSLCASKNVIHNGPSYFDHRSVARSLHSPNLKEILLKMGAPLLIIEYLVDCARSMDKDELFSLLQSTFISYGSPDEAFARRLYNALQSSGVRTYFFPEHAIPGKKLHRLMRDGVNNFDKVILICSKNSLSRNGVLNEIEETLQRESRNGGASYLIPIKLDNFIFEWKPNDYGIAQTIRDRVIVDFSDLEADKTKFDRSLNKLILALKKNLPDL